MFNGKHGKHMNNNNNIVTCTMFRRSSWSLQRLKYNGQHDEIEQKHIQYSGSLHGPPQGLKYDGQQYNIVLFKCSGGFRGPSIASNAMEHVMISLFLQCSGGLGGPSIAAKYGGKHNRCGIFTIFPRSSMVPMANTINIISLYS